MLIPGLSDYAALYREARRVTADAGTAYGAVSLLEAWLRTRGGFTYDERPPSSGAPLATFVTQTKRGYCQHFAGAMALMLRYLGVPARVAVGFTSGRYDSERGAGPSPTTRRTRGSRSGSAGTAG